MKEEYDYKVGNCYIFENDDFSKTLTTIKVLEVTETSICYEPYPRLETFIIRIGF